MNSLRSLSFVLMLLMLLLMLSGCYHMRADAEPILPRTFTIHATSPIALKKIRRLVEDKWRNRVLESEQSGTVLITAPYHFATDTGPGQPPGGRKYYTQLRIELQQRDDHTLVNISQHNYEIRTSYAYGLEGQVRTMYKHYPYQEYPGMFDLVPMNKELDRVAMGIKDLFR